MNINTLNIERGIISSILFNPKLFETSNLNSLDFQDRFNQKLWLTFEKLHQSEKPLNEEFVKIEMNSEFDENKMLEIISTTPISNLKAYIKELKDLNSKNKIQKEIDKIAQIKNLNDIKREIFKLAEKLKSDNSSIFEITDNHKTEAKDTHFYTTNFLPIPNQTITIITASGGGGKSILTLQLTIKFLLENRNKKAFLWYSEDPRGLTKKRIYNIYKLLNLNEKSINDIDNRLKYSDSESFHCIEKNNNFKSEVNLKFYEMKNILNSFDLIIFDPLIGFFGGDENSNSEAREFMQLFTKWASETNKAIIFIHHSSKDKKNGNNARGASAFVDAVRLVYSVETIKDNSTHREITILKDNYNSIGATLKTKNPLFNIEKSSYKVQLFNEPLIIKKQSNLIDIPNIEFEKEDNLGVDYEPTDIDDLF